MWILTYIAKSSMRIAHETMPRIRENLRYIFSSILFEKILNFIIRILWIMIYRIISCLMRDKDIRSSNTNETFFLSFLIKCTTSDVEILLSFPIDWQSVRMITNSTCSLVGGKKTSHISDQPLNIFMEYFIPFTRARMMKINNMKILKSIGT